MKTYAGSLPIVAFWRICALRFFYIVIAIGLSQFIWQQLLFESADWALMHGIAKAMLGAIALLCFIGIFHPLKMLPILIYEMLWKTLWIGCIALPAWLNDRWTGDIETTFFECIGIVLLYIIIPWPYVWARFVKDRDEPWRKRDWIAADKS